jgi:hypothetical protein
MNCIEYQELISGYLDDGLSKEELKILLVHLEACQRCKKKCNRPYPPERKITFTPGNSFWPHTRPEFCSKSYRKNYSGRS